MFRLLSSGSSGILSGLSKSSSLWASCCHPKVISYLSLQNLSMEKEKRSMATTKIDNSTGFVEAIIVMVLYGSLGVAASIEMTTTWQLRKQGIEVSFRILFYVLVDLLCLGLRLTLLPFSLKASSITLAFSTVEIGKYLSAILVTDADAFLHSFFVLQITGGVIFAAIFLLSLVVLTNLLKILHGKIISVVQIISGIIFLVLVLGQFATLVAFEVTLASALDEELADIHQAPGSHELLFDDFDDSTPGKLHDSMEIVHAALTLAIGVLFIFAGIMLARVLWKAEAIKTGPRKKVSIAWIVFLQLHSLPSPTQPLNHDLRFPSP